MPWVRYDDQFPVHRKVAGLSDAAFRLHVSAIFWSARNLTDGFLPRGDLGDVSARVRTPARFAAECVRRNVWHDAAEECASEKCPAPADGDGWVIHDYWEFQPSREQVVREKLAKAGRQKRWLEKRRVSRQSHNASQDGAPPRPETGGAQGAPERPGVRRAAAAPPGNPKTKPPWCGVCDKDTRLTGPADEPYRCPACHPLSPRRTT